MDRENILQMLASENNDVCRKAIKEVAIANDISYLLLIYRLVRKHTDKWIKVEAFETFVKLSSKKAFYFSIDNLEIEKYKEIRAWFICSIGESGKKEYLPLIQPFLSDEDPRVRSDTAEALEALGDPDLEGKLLPMIEDSNHRVKTTVCKLLWKYGAFRVIGILKKMITQEPNKWHRASAAFALGEIGGFQVLDLLYLSLKDKEPEVLRNAIKSLAKCGEISSIPEIINFLYHPDSSVRLAAIEALGIVKDEESFKPLIKLMETVNDSETIDKLQKSLVSIGEFVGSKLVGQVVVYLKSQKNTIRIVACIILSIIGERNVCTFLEKVTNDIKEEEEVVGAAQNALDKINERISS
ncbi:HEAT repeat domain-containing protein [bacterium]|nr:HEAT repeat domain-containing protein [bacterium]